MITIPHHPPKNNAWICARVTLMQLDVKLRELLAILELEALEGRVEDALFTQAT